MADKAWDVDYLVIGAGLAGLAFTDALITESDARVLIVDRRHGPGGHWNDAYPFVRLHQPSAFYGVASRNLGEDRIDESGPNAGYYERATAAEICHYFQEVMEEDLLGSGQVDFLPMHDVIEDGPTATVTSRITGSTATVNVRRKVVDARYLESVIPATHTPAFIVDDGARCVPVNGLVTAEGPAGGYVILGAGKTGMDACVWLLEQGAAPEQITWVKPREAWMIDRGELQPREKVGTFIIAYADSVEASAEATSVPDLFERLESRGSLVRLDRDVAATMFRAPILSEYERERLRTIEHVVRGRRVRRLQADRMVMDDGSEVPVPSGALFVDCTAEGLQSPPVRPIFEERRVTPQGMREGSPSFNAAMVGYLEATRGDDVQAANALAPPNRYPNTALDWIRQRHISMTAQQGWDQTPDIGAWMEGCRLNIAAGMLDHAAEPGVGEALGTYLGSYAPALENLARLRAEAGDAA
ncbi:MAG: NAD(P)-binding protein [Acidimicrobiales bacterium]